MLTEFILMSKKILLLLLGLNFAKAQSITADSITVKSQKKNEVSLDIFQLIEHKRFNFAYERFLKNNTSFSINAIVFENLGYNKSQSWVGDTETHSIQARYVFYVNPKKNHQGFSFSPLVRYIRSFKDYSTPISENLNKKISNIGFGNGVHWKYILKNKVGFQIGADMYAIFISKKFVSRNFNFDNDLILNCNLNYRF